MTRADAYRATLAAMLDEVEAHMLTVCLAPAPRPAHSGHCVRVRMDINPPWYRAFCAAFPSARGVRRGKMDTAIRRRETANALRAMIAGRMPPRYGPRLLDAARSYWRRHKAEIISNQMTHLEPISA